MFIGATPDNERNSLALDRLWCQPPYTRQPATGDVDAEHFLSAKAERAAANSLPLPTPGIRRASIEFDTAVPFEELLANGRLPSHPFAQSVAKDPEHHHLSTEVLWQLSPGESSPSLRGRPTR